MFAAIRRLNQRVFLDSKINMFSVSIFSSFFFVCLSVSSSIFIFVQFSILEIVSVSALFLAMFVILVLLFMPQLRKEKVSLDLNNLVWSICIAIFLLIVLNSPSTLFQDYYRTFPLLEAELELGWNVDSAYHASIVQSLVNLGFPSIGQHGTPPTLYHFLSHLVDSIIVRFTGVGVWESYGLFYFFKSVLLLLSILFFLTYVSRNQKPYVLALSLISFTPIAVYSWHAIGSHGLWFTSLIIILSSPWVFSTLIQSSRPRSKDFALLFVLFVAIALGKISSGFMYAAFAGIILLLSRAKDLRIYIFGFNLVLFFLIFYSAISQSRGAITFDSLENWFTRTPEPMLLHVQILVLIFFSALTSWLYRSRPAFLVSAGSMLAVIVLGLALTLQPGLSYADQFYFTYGLSSVLALFVYQAVVWTLANKKKHKSETKVIFSKVMSSAFLVMAIVLSTNLINFLNVFHVVSYDFVKNFSSQPFANVNSHDASIQANIFTNLSNRNHIELHGFRRPTRDFTDVLHGYMIQNDLSKKNSLLFMPRDVIQQNIPVSGNPWGRGMFIYAVTGVPLIHGVEELRIDFGHAPYGERALQISREEFSEVEACKFGKSVILVDNFSPADFSHLNCKG